MAFGTDVYVSRKHYRRKQDIEDKQREHLKDSVENSGSNSTNYTLCLGYFCRDIYGFNV